MQDFTDDEQRVIDRSWSTEEMQRDFTVHGFAGGFVVVTRNSDGVKGSLNFGGTPRRYHSWKEDA